MHRYENFSFERYARIRTSNVRIQETRTLSCHFVLLRKRIKRPAWTPLLLPNRQPRPISCGRIRLEKSGIRSESWREFDYETTQTAKFPTPRHLIAGFLIRFVAIEPRVLLTLEMREMEVNLYGDAVVLSGGCGFNPPRRFPNSVCFERINFPGDFSSWWNHLIFRFEKKKIRILSDIYIYIYESKVIYARN